MNVNLNKQGQLSANIFLESPAVQCVVDDASYEILVDSDGLTVLDSSGESIHLFDSREGIDIEDILDYLAGLSSVSELALSGKIALRFSDDYAITNEFIEI